MNGRGVDKVELAARCGDVRHRGDGRSERDLCCGAGSKGIKEGRVNPFQFKCVGGFVVNPDDLLVDLPHSLDFQKQDIAIGVPMTDTGCHAGVCFGDCGDCDCCRNC